VTGLKLASGTDLIEIERLQSAIERHGNRLLNRVFTAQELEETGGNPASLAARFAAKEAVAKALGTGIGLVAWQEIEVCRGPARQPVLRLHGAARKLADDLELYTWSISLSHTHLYAIAVAVAIGPG
jgi:holo-[acyl-carrier protein] synthase